MKLPHVRYLGRVAGLSVWLVSGEYVRNHTDIDFTQGGNEAIYTYVPKNEIWLDDATKPFDQTATTFHEMVERYLMLHRGQTYDTAHDAASTAERPFRRELARARPTRWDGVKVAAKYREWLAELEAKERASKTRTRRRRARVRAVKVPKTAKQLEREIAHHLGRQR
jgi:hypothetical protein